MNLNDTTKLYQLFGGQASDYQELRRSDQAKTAKQRWPLLAWLDLSALHVSEAPKVQVGETPETNSVTRPAPSTHVPSAPMNAPFKAPMAPNLSPAARAMSGPAMIPAPIAGPASAAVANHATAPYLQQLLAPPARLQTLGTAPHAVAPVTHAATQAMAAPGTEVRSDLEKSNSANTSLRDIFSRIAQPAPAPTPPAQPTGSLWSNLSSRL